MQPFNADDIESKGFAYGKATAEEYHKLFHTTDAQLAHYVSKSSLTEFARNPYRYRYNIEHGIRKDSQGFRFGSLLDTLVLTPDEFGMRYRVDTPKVALKKDGTPYANGMQDRDQAAEWAALAAQGITVISPDEMAEAEAARDIVNAELARKGLVLGDTFDSQICFAYRLNLPVIAADGTEATQPVIMTGMLDILPRDPSLPIIDLKTTSKHVDSVYELDKDIRSYKYGWQAAIYSDMIRATIGDDRSFRFLFAESAAPHLMAWVDMEQGELEFYRRKYRPQLARYAQCCYSGEWPGAVIEPRRFDVAPWEEFEI